MNGGGGWGDRGAGRTPPARHGIAGSGASRHTQQGGRFFALTRSWVTGALVHLAAGLTGVLVAGVDSKGVPFVVRLNAVKDAVDGEDLDAFVGSITVK